MNPKKQKIEEGEKTNESSELTEEESKKFREERRQKMAQALADAINREKRRDELL